MAVRTIENGICGVPDLPERPLPEVADLGRLSLIRNSEKKWVNGTVLRYYLCGRGDDEGLPSAWLGTDEEHGAVRDGFQSWADLGIGLRFEDTDTRDEAELRIGFERGAGSWSYLGRDVLNIGRDARTMNFGWDIRQEPDTVLHEIGHTLGFPHEHQNPNAGIVWDDAAVLRRFGAPPNNWDEEKVRHNILRKLPRDSVRGSVWDPNSIMHYAFPSGLIVAPEDYATGLDPDPGLSTSDVEWVKKFYPPDPDADLAPLRPFEPHFIDVGPGEQKNFVIEPRTTRKYTIQTFGVADTLMVLFRDQDGGLLYHAADDDSGLGTNARVEPRLVRGERYVLRLRLFYQERSGETAIMLW